MANITTKQLAEMFARVDKVAGLVADFPALKKDLATKVTAKLHDMDPATTDESELEAVMKSFGVIVANLKIEQEKAKSNDTYDVPAQMNLTDFTKKLTKLGAKLKGKDGKNHEQWQLGTKTTALGLDGHGTKTTAKNMKIYLQQLGVTPAEWDKVA